MAYEMDKYRDKRYSGTARVTCTVEVKVGSSWGGECSVAQIHKQAADEACSKLYSIAKEHGIQLVGHPQVTAVLCPPTDE